MITDTRGRGLRGVHSSRGSPRVRTRAVWLAAIAVGLISQAGYAQAPVLTGSTLTVMGTNGNDTITISLATIGAGTIFAGCPAVPPVPPAPGQAAIDPIPKADLVVVQVIIDDGVNPPTIYPTAVQPPTVGWTCPAPPPTALDLTAMNAYIDALYTKDKVKLIIVHAQAGNDVVDCHALAGQDAIKVEMYGEAGNDRMLSGDENDIMDGGPDDDVLMGGKGDDQLNGGSGNDILRGGQGDDTITGGGGFDLLDYANDGGAKQINVNLPAGTATDGWGGSDKIIGAIAAVRARGTDDTLIGNANAPTTILGGGGNDTITGGSRPDVLFGEDGDDTIHGGSATTTDGDYIFGGAGNDVIFGEGGNDAISGDGNDPPLWDTGELLINGDTLTGHDLTAATITPAMIVPNSATNGSGNDEIHGGNESDLIFGGAGNDRIWGDAGVDGLYGDFLNVNETDINGNYVGGNDEIHGGDGISGSTDDGEQDIGFAFSNITNGGLYGGAGADTLYGDNGSDVLEGGPGSDAIYGGDDHVDTNYGDIVLYWNAPAGVNVTLPQLGRSTTVSDGYGNFDTLYGVESVIGSPWDDVLIGNDTALDTTAKNHNHWTIYGRTYIGYDNIIVGWGGNDLIIGGRGNDALVGEAGNDRIWGDGGDQLQGGNDTFWGEGGNNELHGEGGDDTFVLGSGNNLIYGGSGKDTLDYSGAASLGGIGITANFTTSAVSTTIAHFVGGVPVTDTVFNCDNFGPYGAIATIDCTAAVNAYIARVELIIGSSANDTITGYASQTTEIRGRGGSDTLTGGIANDLIYGEDGDDTIEGLGGDDYLVGGGNTAVGDTVSFANAPAAADGVTGVTFTLGNSSAQNTNTGGIDTISGFENVTGSAFNDVLTGDSGANGILGGAGNDVLNGRGDTDVPVIVNDILDGGTGINIADYRNGDPTKVVVNLAAGTAQDGEGGTDTLININSVYLPAGLLFVYAGPDQIVAPGGHVVLEGVATGGNGQYHYLWDTVPPIVPPPGKDPCSDEVSALAFLNNRCIAQPTASPTAETVYRLTVTDTASGGGQSLVYSSFVKVTVATALVVDAGPDLTISFGESVQLQGSASGGVTPYTIAWSPSTGLTPNANVLLPTASPNSTKTYTLTVTDDIGQVASSTMTLTVLNPFIVTARADATTITQGQSTQLHATVQGGAQPLRGYQWEPATDLSLSSTTILEPVARPQTTTPYTISVTDANGRVETASVTVTVNIPGPAPEEGGNQGIGPSEGTGTNQATTPLFPCGLGAGQVLMLGSLSFVGLICARRVRKSDATEMDR